jgi:hypothetical protein
MVSILWHWENNQKEALMSIIYHSSQTIVRKEQTWLRQSFIPRLVINSEHGPSQHSMPSSCKDTKMHAMARDNGGRNITLLSHCTPDTNTKLPILTSENS